MADLGRSLADFLIERAEWKKEGIVLPAEIVATANSIIDRVIAARKRGGLTDFERYSLAKMYYQIMQYSAYALDQMRRNSDEVHEDFDMLLSTIDPNYWPASPHEAISPYPQKLWLIDEQDVDL